jgi:hypothetical protein
LINIVTYTVCYTWFEFHLHSTVENSLYNNLVKYKTRIELINLKYLLQYIYMHNITKLSRKFNNYLFYDTIFLYVLNKLKLFYKIFFIFIKINYYELERVS